MIKHASFMYGPDKPLEMSRFGYDALFADQDDIYVPQNWASLHRNSSGNQPPIKNGFILMMWLSTLACFHTVDKGILETLRKKENEEPPRARNPSLPSQPRRSNVGFRSKVACSESPSTS
jgi:hypothetical protein